MRRSRIVAVLLVGALALAAAGLAVAGSQKNFRVHANGSLEVPANDSKGQGQAIFKLSKDGESLDYKLIVANIENVVMAHIHQGLPGTNGDIVVWLYPSTAENVLAPAGGGRIQGPIADGTITADDLVGPLDGMELSDLIELLRAGNAYVNVHTNDGVGALNTGPGDILTGEIRGNF